MELTVGPPTTYNRNEMRNRTVHRSVGWLLSVMLVGFILGARTQVHLITTLWRNGGLTALIYDSEMD